MGGENKGSGKRCEENRSSTRETRGLTATPRMLNGETTLCCFSARTVRGTMSTATMEMHGPVLQCKLPPV